MLSRARSLSTDMLHVPLLSCDGQIICIVQMHPSPSFMLLKRIHISMLFDRHLGHHRFDFSLFSCFRLAW